MCRRCMKIQSSLVLSLFVLVGCGTSSAVRPDSPRAEGAPKQVCADASSCRDTLRELRSITPGSSCELEERAAVATRACTLGVAEGCTELGRMEKGERAWSLFQRACEQGCGEGCARQALMTFLGEGVPRDEATGRKQLQDACEKYPATACAIGVIGLREDALRQDVSPEEEWMVLFAQQGCDAGDGLSCRMLGDAYREGHGVLRDGDKALALYTRACAAGNGTACAHEGMLSLQLKGARAVTRADALFARGCELGSSEACRLLVLETQAHRQEGEGETTRQALFRQACDRGAAVGCLALYDVLRHQPPEPGRPTQLPGLLKRACRLGEASACEFLEEVTRVSWRQCEADSAPACGVLGVLLLSQPALEAEAAEGRRFLSRACQGGDAASCGLMRQGAPHPDERTCRSL